MSAIPIAGDGESPVTEVDETGAPAEPHRGFGRSVLSVMRGTVLGQVVAVVATPIVSRIFSPGAFGDFALVVSAAATVSALAGFRYETAIPLAESDDEASSTFAVALAGVLLVAILALIIVSAVPTLPGPFRDLTTLREWRFAIPGLVILTGSGQALSNLAIRNRQFDDLSWFRVNQSLPVAFLQVLLGLTISRGPASLIAATLLGQFIACTTLATAVVRHRSASGLRRVTWTRMRQSISRFRNFPLFMTPYGLVSVGRERAVYILLGLFSSTSVVGIYALAYRLTMGPISLITGSLSPVMFQRASVVRDIREVEGLIRTLLTWLVRLSVPAFVLAAVAAQRFAGVLLGSSWQSVGTYAAVLAFPAWLMLQTTWLDRMLDRLGRQKLALSIEVTYSVIAIGAVTAALRSSHSGLVGVVVFAAVTAIYNVIWLLALFRVANFRFGPLSWLGAEALGIAAVSFAVVWFLVSVLPALAAITVSGAVLALFEVLCFKTARARIAI